MKNRILKTTVALLSIAVLCFAGPSPAEDDRSPEEIAHSLMEKLTRRVNEDAIVPLSPGTPWTMRFSRAMPVPRERIFFKVPDAVTKAGGTLPDRIPFTIFRENLRAKAKNPELKPQRIAGGVYDPATDEISLDDPEIEKLVAMKKRLDRRKLEEMLSAIQSKKTQAELEKSDT